MPFASPSFYDVSPLAVTVADSSRSVPFHSERPNMGTAFWIRRTATVFAIVATVLYVVSLLKGRGFLGSAEFAAVWAAASTAVFVGARLYQSSRGQHCELCQDVPAPLPEAEGVRAPAR